MALKELLTKEYSISDLTALFRTDKFLKRDKLRFVSGNKSVNLLPGECKVAIVPLRTLAVFPFSFPFGKKVSVRDALELRFRPLLGAQESKLNLVTQVTKQKTNETSGIAWFVSKEETEQLERQFRDSVLWPSPLLFVSRVKGNGVVVCRYEDGCCGMLFADGEPKLYRWLALNNGSAEQLCDELAAAAKDYFAEEAEICVVEPEKESVLQKTGDAVLELCPSAYGLNLSSLNVSAKAEAEKFIDKLLRFAQLVTLLGAIFLVSSVLLLGVNLMWRGSFRKAPSQVYEISLREQSSSPLSSVMQKLRALNVENSGQESFETHYRRVSSVWNGLSSRPVFDGLRYSNERIQLSGTASGAAEVDALRRALGDKGYDAVTENAQQLPKAGMRFTISLTERKKQ